MNDNRYHWEVIETYGKQNSILKREVRFSMNIIGLNVRISVEEYKGDIHSPRVIGYVESLTSPTVSQSIVMSNGEFKTVGHIIQAEEVNKLIARTIDIIQAKVLMNGWCF